MRHHFVGHKFEKDLLSQCERPLNIRLYIWRKMFNLSRFECNNHSMTPQGLIDHLYVRAFSKNGYIYHVATFYYLFEMYDGKENFKRLSHFFSLNNSLSLFTSFEVKR